MNSPDSTLVYNEFMSVIKGSDVSLKRRKPYLDRHSYETQSNRAWSSDHAERSRIYTLFEAYIRLRSPSSYDIPDRIHLLLTTLEENGVPGKHLDFLYVDEVQDHLILDAALLKYLCPNPHGLFFAGDTARTILAGSPFRFSELKSALYHLEREDVNVKRGTRKPVDPHFFQLSTDYRRHSVIVNAAAFIISLIGSYFPHSIDPLAPEAIVHVSAHKPTFFSGRGDLSDLLRFISDNRSGCVGLGAQQVIIVRDDAASRKLQENIGTVAIVLTIYESKDMEYSPAAATDWRGLLRAQQEGKTLDKRRHSILQTELKSLYVGLTRARKRVWMWDCSENGRDMEALLVASSVATSPTMSYIVPQVGVSSTSEEWRDRGQQFFVDQLFSEAALCFTKAKLDWWTKVARTYHDRQVAMRLAESREEPVSAFAEIARSFEALAGCVENSQDSRVLFANAAECFATIPDHKAAADAFFKAEKYTESAFHYHMAVLPDKAIEIARLLGT